MNIFTKKLSVRPNHKGLLFKENIFAEVLNPGVYRYFDFGNKLSLLELPMTLKLVHVINQEVLTKDNIALRFSFVVSYQIEDGAKYAQSFNLFDAPSNVFYDAENLIRIQTQVYLREKISTIESPVLNEHRAELTKSVKAEIGDKFKSVGLNLNDVVIIDFTFPKMIQDLFSKDLEAKVRARAEQENARTAVATARTLKNAAEMMKQNEDVKFIQVLELISKIAEKGKHTFHFGEMLNGRLLNKQD